MPPQFRLRKPTVADAPFVVWLDTPAAVREHVLMAMPPTQEQAENIIERWLTFCDPFGYFIIEMAIDSRPVGWVHAKPCAHIDGAIELGWRLHQMSGAMGLRPLLQSMSSQSSGSWIQP
jgi:hypothetical protein